MKPILLIKKIEKLKLYLNQLKIMTNSVPNNGMKILFGSIIKHPNNITTFLFYLILLYFSSYFIHFHRSKHNLII